MFVDILMCKSEYYITTFISTIRKVFTYINPKKTKTLSPLELCFSFTFILGFPVMRSFGLLHSRFVTFKAELSHERQKISLSKSFNKYPSLHQFLVKKSCWTLRMTEELNEAAAFLSRTFTNRPLQPLKHFRTAKTFTSGAHRRLKGLIRSFHQRRQVF